METRLKVFGRSEPLKKAIGAAKWQSRQQKISIFSACNAPGNQREIRIAFFERDKNFSRTINPLFDDLTDNNAVILLIARNS